MTINPDEFELDFFECYPQLKPIFKEESKMESGSDLMWAHVLFIHPDSDYSVYMEEERKKKIGQIYESRIRWSKERFEKLKAHCLTQIQKSLIIWRAKVVERDYFLESLDYNEDNYEIIEEIMAKSAKNLEQLEKMEDRYIFKKSQDKTQGGQDESLLEKMSN